MSTQMQEDGKALKQLESAKRNIEQQLRADLGAAAARELDLR